MHLVIHKKIKTVNWTAHCNSQINRGTVCATYRFTPISAASFIHTYTVAMKVIEIDSGNSVLRIRIQLLARCRVLSADPDPTTCACPCQGVNLVGKIMRMFCYLLGKDKGCFWGENVQISRKIARIITLTLALVFIGILLEARCILVNKVIPPPSPVKYRLKWNTFWTLAKNWLKIHLSEKLGFH